MTTAPLACSSMTPTANVSLSGDCLVPRVALLGFAELLAEVCVERLVFANANAPAAGSDMEDL
jgi:hypothetical protein